MLLSPLVLAFNFSRSLRIVPSSLSSSRTARRISSQVKRRSQSRSDVRLYKVLEMGTALKEEQGANNRPIKTLLEKTGTTTETVMKMTLCPRPSTTKMTF